MPALQVLLSVLAFAKADLELLRGGEWKGECRAAVSHDPSPSAGSLRSSYGWEKKELFWKVSAFKDSACRELRQLSRYLFSCRASGDSEFATCKERRTERSSDGKRWSRERENDRMRLQLRAERAEGGKLLLITRDGEESEDREILER